ncbi:MAG: WD40 repeat domain-containing protein [Planctomycetota bacterium]|jgi:WD40 repeat protein
MGLNLTLILTIFLTRERWDAWIVECRKPCEDIVPHTLALSSDARRAVIELGENLVLWDVERSLEVAAYPRESLYFAAFSPDDTKLLVGVSSKGNEEEIVVVDAETGERLATIDGADDVAAKPFSRDGRLVLAADVEGPAGLWDADDGSIAVELGECPDDYWNAEFFPDGETILTAGPGDVRLWDARTGELRAQLVDDDAGHTYAGVYADGRNVFICSGRRTFLVEVASGTRLAEFGACLYWSANETGSVLAAWGIRGSPFVILDAASGGTLFELQIDAVTNCHFADGGRRLLVETGWDYPDSMFIIDARTGNAVGEFLYHNNAGAFDLSPDGARVLTMKRWESTRIHSASTGALLAEWPEAYIVGFLGNDRVMLNHRGKTKEVRVLRRIRPEEWWGVFWLPHLWLIVALGAALAWSGWRDIRRMRGTAAGIQQGCTG